jgi:hypothetical protein
LILVAEDLACVEALFPDACAQGESAVGKLVRQISVNSGESQIFPSLTSNWNVSSSLQYSNLACSHEAHTVVLVVTNSYALKILTR